MNTSRRHFVKSGALGALAVSVSGFVLFEKGKYVGDCATTSDVLGPFYRPEAPFRSNLILNGQSGTSVIVKGRVFSHCSEPLKQATVDIWHCDGGGEYDNTSDLFNCRGRQLTTAAGDYQFTTINPPPYGNRPKHIHFRVYAEGHQELISQLYFKGDPTLSRQGSAWQRHTEARILPTSRNAEGVDEITFDIYLRAV
ncbi:MAG: hypothetical protein AAFX87_07220 [Bacteroidota bacterium]